MEAPRTSLWSRLVFFYSQHKPDQLKPEVMAEIVGKYGSRESELSARLRKKYGRPLPSEVSAHNLRQVLTTFCLEDMDSRARRRPVTPPCIKTAAEPGDKDEKKGQARILLTLTERCSSSTMLREDRPDGSALDFRSQFFDAMLRRHAATAAVTAAPQSSMPVSNLHELAVWIFCPEAVTAATQSSMHVSKLHEALRHSNLRPPYPNEPALDNLAKFYRLLPKPPSPPPPAKAVAAVSLVTVPGGGMDASTRQSPAVPATARDSAVLDDSAVGIAANPVASGASDRSNNTRCKGRGGSVVGDRVNTVGGGGGRGGPSAEMKDNGATAASVGGSIDGHYGPPALKSAADIEKLDRELAHRRRAAELGPARSITEPDRQEQGVNPLQRIMQGYVGTGPYSLLYRLHEEKRRANVMIRRLNSIRGTCSGLIRAFDRHMNMLLVDVREDYTVLIPIRDHSSRQARPASASSDDSDSDKAGERPGVGSGEGPQRDRESSVTRADRGHATANVSHSRHMNMSEPSKVAQGVSDRTPPSEEAEVESAHVQGRESRDVNADGKQVETVYSSRAAGSAFTADVRHGCESHGPRDANDRVIDSPQDQIGVLENRISVVHCERNVDDERRVPADPTVDDDRPREAEMKTEDTPAGRVEDERDGTLRRKSSRRSRRRGARTGQVESVRRRRFLKQLLIRGDNVVMVWEAPK